MLLRLLYHDIAQGERGTMRLRVPQNIRNGRQWLAVVGVLLLLGVAFLIYAGVSGLFESSVPGPDSELSGPPSAADESPQTSSAEILIGTTVGRRAPEFRLSTFDGRSVALSDFAGHVVILDFWASWCSPCRASMPTLHALWEQYRDRGVVLLGVSLDRTESAGNSYIQANGFDDMIAVWDSHQTVAALYGISGIPHTLIIDADGIIRFANHPAYLTASVLDATL
jgi:cytochrome c biogenesis protein CcmG/thiol:disulfide interchange protein DsbE